MAKQTETVFHEGTGMKARVTWDDTDPDRPLEIVKSDMDADDRRKQLRKRLEERRSR